MNPAIQSIAAQRALEAAAAAQGMGLMRRAACAAADKVRALLPEPSPVTVLAGPGNNGGDALHLACELVRAGYPVTVVSPAPQKGDEAVAARARWDELAKLTVQPADAKPAPALLCINAGKRDKLRPGDILGALTGEGGLPGTAIGKIQLSDTASYVAIAPDYAKQALAWLDGGRIKTRSVKARIL